MTGGEQVGAFLPGEPDSDSRTRSLLMKNDARTATNPVSRQIAGRVPRKLAAG
jgi:hypothetical protein